MTLTSIPRTYPGCGRKLSGSSARSANEKIRSAKPMIVVVDSDSVVRESMKVFLDDQGYEIIAVNNVSDAREVLNLFTAALASDYSGAHSLGAVVCMAKPYKKERLGHIVRLLAPLPRATSPRSWK